MIYTNTYRADLVAEMSGIVLKELKLNQKKVNFTLSFISFCIGIVINLPWYLLTFVTKIKSYFTHNF